MYCVFKMILAISSKKLFYKTELSADKTYFVMAASSSCLQRKAATVANETDCAENI